MKYAAFDENGNIMGFYTPEIHGKSIPTEAAEISDNQWMDCLRNPGKWKIDSVSKIIVLAPILVPSNDELLTGIRAERDQYLKDTDYTQLLDAPISQGEQLQWAAYRQALRNFPATCNPSAPVWPTKPKKGV